MQVELFGSLPLAIVAVVALAVATLGFAFLIGRWIDAQSNTVVDEPKKPRKRDTPRE